jgi:cation transport protein ChaC
MRTGVRKLAPFEAKSIFIARAWETVWLMLTRENLQNGWLDRMTRNARAAGDTTRIRTEAELAACRASALAGHAPGQDLWLFAYGSLIWNPAFHFAERRQGCIWGYHRRFCLWTNLGRGTVQRPGLMLGLDRGGSCRGVLYRIAADLVEEELTLVWRREMITAAYRPTWVQGRTSSGPVQALTFTINRAHPRYAGKLGEERVVETLATAAGPLGPCCDYLFNTHRHLAELAIHDRQLGRLCAAVRDRQAAAPAQLANSMAPATTGP